MTTPAARLRELLQGDPFVAGDCYSALTARIVEDIGFPAAYMGGHGTGMMHYALPDYGVLTTTEMIEQAARVVEAIDIPLVVDADEAGDSVSLVARSIRLYENAGVAGVHIEDETVPKHSPFDAPLLSISDMQARIDAAVNARKSEDFVIIARTNEFMVADGGGTGSLEEVIRRGVAYANAGADGFIPAPYFSDEELAAMAAEVKIPIGGYSGLQPGLQFVLRTGWGVSAAARIHHYIGTHVFQHGKPPEDYEPLFPNKRELIRQDTYDAIVQRWAERTGRPTRQLPRGRAEHGREDRTGPST